MYPYSDGSVSQEASERGGMNVDGFSGLNSAERGHFWFEPRNRLILGLLNRYFADAASFMEIGCGTGFVLSAIAAQREWADLVGTEMYNEGLDFARRRLPDANLIQMDARNIPFRDRFDVIGAFDVIEHIREDETVLHRCRDALKQDGGIILTVPQHQWLWSDVDDLSHHVRRYSRKELKTKLDHAGFDVLFIGSYTTLLLPLMALSRLRKRNKENLDAELRVSPLINAVFRRALDAEVSITLSGISLPVGGSCVAVARRR
jgi:SAM-dependent methyltransferase